MKKIIGIIFLIALVFATAVGCTSKESASLENHEEINIADTKDKDALYTFVKQGLTDVSREDFDKWGFYYSDITGDSSDEVVMVNENGEKIEIVSGDSGEYQRIPSEIYVSPYGDEIEFKDGFLVIKGKSGGTGAQYIYMSLYAFDQKEMVNVLEQLNVLEDVNAPSQNVSFQRTGEIDGKLTDFVYTVVKHDNNSETDTVEKQEQYTYNADTKSFAVKSLEIQSKSQSGNENDSDNKNDLTTQYIGLKIKDSILPDGLSESMGWIYNGKESATKEYLCAVITDGSQEIIWLERVLKSDGNTIETEVVDAIACPEYGYSLNSDLLVTCLLKDGKQYEGIALAIPSGKAAYDDEYFENFYKAWRVNEDTDKFEEMPADGLKGENPAYGI